MCFADKTQRSRCPDVDRDGDLVLDRCHQVGKAVAIHHACSTDLSRVGLQVASSIRSDKVTVMKCHILAIADPRWLVFETSWDVQVWPGAMLLADYILEHEKYFACCVGMEIGAGTGFAGLVLAQTARRVFLTDHDAGVLCNCQRNVEANATMFKQGPGVAQVRYLDVFHAVSSDPGDNLCSGRHSGNTSADAGVARCLLSWHHHVGILGKNLIVISIGLCDGSGI